MDAEQSSREQHKPLTAAEIEILWELEAKATKGEWEFEAHGPGGQMALYSGRDNEHHGLRLFNANDGDMKYADNLALIAAMRNALPRLLSMLQPPNDAAVREAEKIVEPFLSEACAFSRVPLADAIRTLLSHVRAAQSPGLAEEQETLLREATVCLPYKNRGLAKRIRAAFPSLFGKEG